MKIIITSITSYPDIGGVQTSMMQMYSELEQLGNELLIVTLTSKYEEEGLHTYRGIKIWKKYCKPSRIPLISEAVQSRTYNVLLSEVLAKFNPDIFISRHAIPSYALARRGFGNKLFHIYPTTANLDLKGRLASISTKNKLTRLKYFIIIWLQFLIKKKHESFILQKAKGITFSQMMKKQLIKAHGIKARDVKVLLPGVDTKRFGVDLMPPTKRDVKPNKYSSDILYVGRLAINKNIYMLIDSINIIDDPNITVNIVGSGPEEERLKQYVEAKNVKSKVNFVGPKYNDLGLYYKYARVTVLPSIVETFGQAIIESLACGTPVVAFKPDNQNIITASDEIIDNKVGALVETYSSVSLADGINSILKIPPDHYNKMSYEGIKLVNEKYSWSYFGHQLSTLCQKSCLEEEGSRCE